MAATPEVKRISVVMTTYNGEKYLDAQLRSIFAQSLTPVEIIICDDGSTDDTISIIQGLQQENATIRYVQNETRRGVVGNFKKAVSLAGDTDYLALSDQDDIWYPDKLKMLCASLSSADTNLPGISYSDMVLVDSIGTVRNPSFWHQLGHDGYRHCFETLLYGNFVTGCTIMMNRHMRPYFAEMPDDVAMHDSWLALVAFSLGFANEITEPLMEYRSHESNVVFSEHAHRKQNLAERLMRHARNIFLKNDFLESEIRTACKLKQQYHSQLSPIRLKQVDELLKLKKASYWRKWLAVRSVLQKNKARHQLVSNS